MGANHKVFLIPEYTDTYRIIYYTFLFSLEKYQLQQQNLSTQFLNMNTFNIKLNYLIKTKFTFYLITLLLL